MLHKKFNIFKHFFFFLLFQENIEKNYIVYKYLCFRSNPNLYNYLHHVVMFVCVEVLRPSQPNGVMSSAVSLPNHTFTGQA